MKREKKADVVAEVSDLLNGCTAVYLTDYSGINVEDISKLRREFRKEGVKYKVIKNTLFKRAIDSAGKFEKLADHLTGMTGFVFAYENPVAPAKIIKKYNDDKKKLPLKACYIETTYYDGSQLEVLATLPSKAEIIAGILGSLYSPVSGVVGSINAVMRDLLSVIEESVKKKEGQAA